MAEKKEAVKHLCPECGEIVCPTSVRKKNFYCEDCNKVFSLTEVKKK